MKSLGDIIKESSLFQKYIENTNFKAEYDEDNDYSGVSQQLKDLYAVMALNVGFDRQGDLYFDDNVAD